MIRILLALLAFFTFASCVRGADAPGPSPIVVPDTDECKAMCDHLGRGGLNCEEGLPVYNSDRPGPKDVPNESCEEFCRDTQAMGVFLNPRCLKSVPTCGQIEEWRKKTCRD